MLARLWAWLTRKPSDPALPDRLKGTWSPEAVRGLAKIACAEAIRKSKP